VIHSPQIPSTEPALLLVVAHGVGANALRVLRAHDGLPRCAVSLGRSSEGATTLLRGCADAVPLLRELGVATDRSSLVLRSTTACDDSAIAALSRRPTGPANATILELRSVVQAGLTAGLDAVPAALSQLAERIAAAARRVRSGEPTEVWLLGLGDLQPVTATFDFERAWQDSKAAPIARELESQVGLGCVTIRASNERARDIARDVLTREPFRQFGSVTTTFDLQLRFLAAANVAFGRERVAARPPDREEAELQALLPRQPRASEIALDLRTMIARFWMRAAAHADLRAVTPVTSVPTTGAPPAGTVPASVDGATSLVQITAPATEDEVDPVDSAPRRR